MTGGPTHLTASSVSRRDAYNATGSLKRQVVEPMLFSERMIANDMESGELWWYDLLRANDPFDLDYSCHPMLFEATHPTRRGRREEPLRNLHAMEVPTEGPPSMPRGYASSKFSTPGRLWRKGPSLFRWINLLTGASDVDVRIEKSDLNILARPFSEKKCENPLPLTGHPCYKTQLRRIFQHGVSIR